MSDFRIHPVNFIYDIFIWIAAVICMFIGALRLKEIAPLVSTVIVTIIILHGLFQITFRRAKDKANE